MPIYKRSGSWCVDVRIQGRRYRKRIGKSKHLADLALKDLELKAERGQLGFLERKEITVEAFLQEFRAYSKANHRLATVTRYKAVCDNFLRFIQKQTQVSRLSQVAADTIEKYKIWRKSVPVARNGWEPGRVKKEAVGAGAKNYTVNFELTALRTLFNLAIKWKYLERNAASEVKLLKTDDSKPRRFLTEEECGVLLEAASAEHREIFFALLNTGMRRAELVNLEWSDIDFRARMLKIQRKSFWLPKTGEREIPLNEDMVLLLNRLPRKSNFVFVDKKGQPVDADNLRQHLIRTARKAGIQNLTELHALRHTFASHLLMRGVDIPTVQKLMGHRDIETTMIYSHQTTDHLRSAVAKLQFQAEKSDGKVVRIGAG